MHRNRNVIIFIFSLFLILPFYGQENSTLPQRTPEHEASKQTERMQSELGLTDEQVKLVYDINLRYERERIVSNRRKDALERMQKKNEDLKKVLSEEQYAKLQSKRYSRNTVVEIDSSNVKKQDSVARTE